MPLNKGDRIDVRFHFRHPIAGMKGVYRPDWELEPAYIVEFATLGMIRVKFVREPIFMYIDRRDVDKF